MLRASIIIFSLLMMISPASAQPGDEVDLKILAQAINLTMRENHYDPSELETEGYLRTEENILKLADTATSEEEFLIGFSQIWRDGHFRMLYCKRPSKVPRKPRLIWINFVSVAAERP